MRLLNLHQQLSRNLATNRLSHFDIFCMVKLIVYTTLIHQIFTNSSVCTVLKHTADLVVKVCAVS